MTSLAGTAVDVTADVIPIVDTSVTTTKKILPNQLALSLETEGSDVASAAAPDIWGIGQTKHITGTTPITSFAAAPFVGMWRKLLFDDAVLLTHSANLNILGAHNYLTQAGDVVYVYADTTTQFDILITTMGTTASTVAAGSAMSLTDSTSVDLTSISLTAGEWDIFAAVSFIPTATTRVTAMIQSVSTTSATLDQSAGRVTAHRFGNSGVGQVLGISASGHTFGAVAARVGLDATTVHYLVVQADFTVSTMTAYGKIWARRQQR